MEFVFVLIFAVIPALASITVLLPDSNWKLRIKALVARGALKIPFGMTFGFFGILLLELARKDSVPDTSILFISAALLYLFLFWLYLYVYKVLLNKVLNEAVTWHTLIKSIVFEVGMIIVLVLVAVAISIAANLTFFRP